MRSASLGERAPQTAAASRLDRLLGHPVAFIATAVILLAIFGWTFFTNPERVAPTKDPAYYTWRTEALLTETPETLLEIEGPHYAGGEGMFSGGYRVAAPVLGGLLRRIASVAPLSTTAFLMVGLPVLTALLLGAFAYQHRPDPLIFHGVAFAAGGLYLTPPFVGYLDNVLALFFVAGALLFLRDVPRRPAARVGFGAFLLMVGFTHPTTLVIFFMTLVAMALIRLVYRRFDVKSVIRDDGPSVVVAFLSIVAAYALWKVGIWGRSASLGDAALSPPYEASFFVDRLVLWLKAMRPVVNGPLFVLGAATLLASGRRVAEDELARVSIVWLAPLVGLFGFLAGASYPYYRFFNTTLAWVLLVGVGVWVAARFFILLARRGGIHLLAWVGVVALVVVIGTNFYQGLTKSGWGNARGGWLSAAERDQLDDLRAALSIAGEPRPVVFLIDSADTSPRVYGYTKLSGNTSRYALPAGWIDEGHVFLGSLDDLAARRPTSIGAETYDAVSLATYEELEDALRGPREPIIAVVEAFNEDGANAQLIGADADEVAAAAPDREVWIVTADGITAFAEGHSEPKGFALLGVPRADATHVIRVVMGLLVLLLPGSLAARWLLRDATFPEWLALAPALAVAFVTLIAIAVLAATRDPLGRGAAWVSLLIAIAVTAMLAWRSNPPQPDPNRGVDAAL